MIERNKSAKRKRKQCNSDEKIKSVPRKLARKLDIMHIHTRSYDKGIHRIRTFLNEGLERVANHISLPVAPQSEEEKVILSQIKHWIMHSQAHGHSNIALSNIPFTVLVLRYTINTNHLIELLVESGAVCALSNGDIILWKLNILRDLISKNQDDDIWENDVWENDSVFGEDGGNNMKGVQSNSSFDNVTKGSITNKAKESNKAKELKPNEPYSPPDAVAIKGVARALLDYADLRGRQLPLTLHSLAELISSRCNNVVYVPSPEQLYDIVNEAVATSTGTTSATENFWYKHENTKSKHSRINKHRKSKNKFNRRNHKTRLLKIR
eukprot:m.76475 g.76475  ORF g.76475 m.76475 type:complete len:324 (+) comp12561_c0_seq2:264-1235(+)